MKFGQDDESPLNQLVNELDLHSALARLTRVGFKVVGLSKHHHHLTRPRGEGQEDLLIRLERNQFVIQHAHNGEFAPYDQIIASWDDWITFVRLLVLRAPSCHKRGMTECDEELARHAKCPKH